MRLTHIVVGLLLLAGALALLIHSDQVEASNPSGSIEIDQEAAFAQVAPGQSGIVTFTGVISIQNSGLGSTIQTIMVNLAADAQGWPVSIVPEVMEFQDTNGSQSFAATVSVPPDTPMDKVGTITVSGTGNVQPGVKSFTLSSDSASILIKQYYDFEVNCTTPFQEARPGDSTVFKISLTNTGNGDDKVGIYLDNYVEVTGNGLTPIWSTNEVTIGPDLSAMVSLTIEVPSSMTGNKVYNIKLLIYSITAQELGEIPIEITYPLHLRVKDQVTDLVPGFELSIFAFAAVIVIAFAGRRLYK